MPIERYKDIADVPPPPKTDPSDPTFAERVLNSVGSPFAELPPLFRPGVYKYRSIEEANEAMEAAMIERARLLRERERQGR